MSCPAQHPSTDRSNDYATATAASGVMIEERGFSKNTPAPNPASRTASSATASASCACAIHVAMSFRAQRAVGDTSQL